jgi:Xaa-Pro aminopeptidase
MRKNLLLTVMLLAGLSAGSSAQPVITNIFPPEEFAARRAKVLEQIGDGVAILQGTTERPGEQPLRQSNQVYYLCGVIEPRAILVLDGKTKRSTLYLYGGAERRERMFGSAMFPGDAAARATGLDSVLAREEFAKALGVFVRDGRTLYTPFRPEVLGNASSSDVVGHAKSTKDDPWDGRPSREEAFIQKIKGLAPQINVQNLDPMLDTMRAFKTPREIAIIREATRITGLGIMEAMRDARPGMFEYELQADAEFVFKKYGSQGAAYFALIATGQNTLYSHYHKNTAKLQDGDLVQFDYAPDYKYYVSDVTRVFPVR